MCISMWKDTRIYRSTRSHIKSKTSWDIGPCDIVDRDTTCEYLIDRKENVTECLSTSISWQIETQKILSSSVETKMTASWDMKYSYEMRKKEKRHVTRRITEAPRVLELRRMMKRRRRRTRTMTTKDYKSITCTLVMFLWIFGRFSLIRFREKESGCMRMKRGRGKERR